MRYFTSEDAVMEGSEKGSFLVTAASEVRETQ
jgi:hypothetical protein